MLLDGHRLLITGVLTDRSIAFRVAERAQQEGAEVLLTGVGRSKRLTARMAQRLPEPPDVLELDVNAPDDLAALRATLTERWGRVDGVLHAIAHVPPDGLGGNFLRTSPESAEAAFRTSAFSLQALAGALLPLLEASERSPGIVGLDFDASRAWPAYDWAGVSKAALEAISRYLARDLGPKGIRSNLVAAGPVETVAAGAIGGFEALAGQWADAPLAWDAQDAGPVADAVLFLLSPLARAVTGEILHADGGLHAVVPPRA